MDFYSPVTKRVLFFFLYLFLSLGSFFFISIDYIRKSQFNIYIFNIYTKIDIMGKNQHKWKLKYKNTKLEEKVYIAAIK